MLLNKQVDELVLLALPGLAWALTSPLRSIDDSEMACGHRCICRHPGVLGYQRQASCLHDVDMHDDEQDCSRGCM